MFSLPRLALLSFLTLTNIYWCLFFEDNSSGASTEIIAVYFPGPLSCCVSLSVCAVYWFWDRLAALHPGRSCSLTSDTLTRWHVQDVCYRFGGKKKHKTTALDCIKHRVIQSNWVSRATKPAIKVVTSNICLKNELSIFVCGENTSCLTFRTEVLAQTLYGIVFFFFQVMQLLCPLPLPTLSLADLHTPTAAFHSFSSPTPQRFAVQMQVHMTARTLAHSWKDVHSCC